VRVAEIAADRVKPVRTIRVVIVDDEEPARARVRRMLSRHADFEIVGECDGGASAVETIRTQQPDLVFLDVHMPDLDGFEVIERLGLEHMPRVVFVTAYDDYAVRGFEVDALDYLLKPFEAERFDATVDRIRALGRERAPLTPEQWAALMERLGHVTAREGGPYLDRLLLYHNGVRTYVKLDDVDWIAAADNYSRLRCGTVEHLHRISLRELESRLDPRKFVRIHRSTIVNLDRVKEIRPQFSGDHLLTLKDGTELRVSRRYRERLV